MASDSSGLVFQVRGIKEAINVGSERRQSARFPFFASAEITELGAEARLTARTSELSRHGCYMDMMNPLPVGTAVRINITYEGQTFEARASVVYCQPNMGMGVSFGETKAPQELVLEKWLTDLRKK